MNNKIKVIKRMAYGFGTQNTFSEKSSGLPGKPDEYIKTGRKGVFGGFLLAFNPGRRTLRNMRIRRHHSPQLSGCQELATVRNTRSGCGIMMVARPSALVTAVIPSGEPLGLTGHCATLPQLSETQPHQTALFAAQPGERHRALPRRPSPWETAIGITSPPSRRRRRTGSPALPPG